MPILPKINDANRNLWAASANINGVLRDLNAWSNINGVWRENHKHAVEESEIVGFRMIYKLMEKAVHPDYPKLIVNNNLPVITKLTGDRIGDMSGTTKGIVFEYSKEEYEKQGIMVYRGDLYAVLQNEQLVNVGMSISDAASDKRIPTAPGVKESWCTNKLANLFIQITGYMAYESYGYFMSGWNSMFTTEQFIDPSNYPDKGPHKNKFPLNSYSILPIEERVSTFDSASYIGIARDMTSETNNMIGSSGTIDHTISAISVNGIEKPFVIELYH